MVGTFTSRRACFRRRYTIHDVGAAAADFVLSERRCCNFFQGHHFVVELAGCLLDDFVESITLSQEPVWAAQAHVTRNVLGRGWLGVGLAYAVGGKIDLDGERVDYRVDNVLWNLVGGYRLTRHQSVMVAWQQGRTQVDVGQDSDSWLLSWVYAWGG